jgi:hypothetical protein
MNSINKKENTKESITRLADEAKQHINKNKYLIEIIEIFKQQISIVKNIIRNYSLNTKQNDKFKDNLPIKYREQLSSLNKRLKEEVNKNLTKHENSINYILKDLSSSNQTLAQFNIDNFILNNTINKYNDTIKILNESIDSSRKYDLFREPKRETEIELKESKNVFLVYNLECQQKMLSYCRDYAKYKSKNVIREIKINAIKNNISILKNIIKYYCSKVYGDGFKLLTNINDQKTEDNQKIKKSTKNPVDIKKRIGTTPNEKNYFGKIKNNENFSEKKNIQINEKKEDNEQDSFDKNKSNDNSFNKTSLIFETDANLLKNIYKKEDEKDNSNTEENTERKKINILKIDELLDIENIEIRDEDEDIIDDELNSDDEVYFEKKVKSKKRISTDFLPNIKTQIPSINLSQIEFNKLKVINEADAYSLQKRKFEQGNINGQIKNLKKQIKNLGKRISINKKKLEVIHSFIEDVKYNYRLLRPIKIQTSAAGNPVNYIRERLLDVVGESISQSEKKENKIEIGIGHDKNKTGKTAVEEGEENDEELVGSDYSEEEDYRENEDNKGSNSDNKENENNENISNKNKVIKLKENKKNNNKIKTNLISRFELDEKDDNIFGNIGNINAQSK